MSPAGPINEFVAQLQDHEGRGWLPDVPPNLGDGKAKGLSILRDPGRFTLKSGVLSGENRDPTTARQLELFAKFDISLAHVLPWNAYPWFIDRKPSSADLDAGAKVLSALVDLLPALRGVLLQGNEAAAAWDRVIGWRPRLVEQRGLVVARCIHPSPRALICDQTEREARKKRQENAFRCFGEALSG
ncbi:MAG: hypothetical protein WCE30_06780 [Mycobacterium sp.]